MFIFKTVANLKALLQSKNIYVKKTLAKGWGLFARRAFRKNETLFVIKGSLVTETYDSRYRKGARWISIGSKKWLNPFPHNGLWFLNHSCRPNAGRKGIHRIVAMKKIGKDDEITLDYSTTEEDPFWKMKCRCHEKTCRKILRSIQSLPVGLFRKYQDYVPAHLRRTYESRLKSTQN